MMDTRRLILLVIFSFSLVMLWEAWQRENRPPPPPKPAATEQSAPAPSVTPGPSAAVPGASVPGIVPSDSTAAAVSRARITVTTDLVSAEIDPLGGDLVRLELLKHKDGVDPSKNLVLLGPDYRYAAQSGFIGTGVPFHRTLYRAEKTDYKLEGETLTVRLEASPSEGIAGVKTLTFRRGSYVVDIGHELTNNTQAPVPAQAYFQLTRDNRALPGDSYMLQTFTGPAFDDGKKYEKLSWDELEPKSREKLRQKMPSGMVEAGWIAIVQHYFVSALIPEKGAREFYAEQVEGGIYRAGLKLPPATVEPGATLKIGMPLYAGPQEQDNLEALAPRLNYVVDYGVLTIICQPLFWILKLFHGWVHNWGWAIVLLTVLIKLIFFPLSAASYKSMAKMKLVTPRLMKLREQYGDDRVKMNQAMMELYKTEKINPLGGCLPILVQIPVFIALYWVLLQSVELRHAPFLGWIKDLSAADPWFVLPALMMISMIIQTKMNPTPPDPVQAKVMMIMPFAFGIMFFWFPAGLVLYWFINNLLSIAQQWQITKMIEGQKPAKGGKAA